MQYLAQLAAKQDALTAITTLSDKYSGTKWDFIGNSTNIGIELFDIHFTTDNITNPHQPISYYVLSKGIN